MTEKNLCRNEKIYGQASGLAKLHVSAENIQVHFRLDFFHRTN